LFIRFEGYGLAGRGFNPGVAKQESDWTKGTGW